MDVGRGFGFPVDVVRGFGLLVGGFGFAVAVGVADGLGGTVVGFDAIFEGEAPGVVGELPLPAFAVGSSSPREQAVATIPNSSRT